MNKFTRVIAAFPGCGKTYMQTVHLDISDSDSSTFDKTAFPGNYITHIRERLDVGATFVSSHGVVRDAMVAANIDFWLVYPDRSCKEEYLQRYRDRGSPQKFVELLDSNWDNWISECEAQEASHKIVLQQGQFLYDVLLYDKEEKFFMTREKIKLQLWFDEYREDGDIKVGRHFIGDQSGREIENWEIVASSDEGLVVNVLIPSRIKD